MDREDLLEAAIWRAAEDMSCSLDEHPSAELLCAYFSGEANAEAADRLQDHVSLCRKCCHFLLEAADFLRPLGADDILKAESVNAWSRLEKQLQATPSAACPRTRRVPRAPQAHLAYVLAATLALLCTGLSIYTVELRRELSIPTAGIVLVDLLSEGSAVRGFEPREERPIPSGTERRLYILHSTEPSRHLECRIALRDRDTGKVEWSESGLYSDESGNFNIELPSGYPSSRHLEFKLYGRQDGRETLLAVFPLPGSNSIR
jgi:hypothetical protein